MNAPRRPRKAAKRPTARRRPATGRDFWGTDNDDEVAEAIRPTDDPAAMVNSLGPVPVRGREIAAAQYFDAVYDKAVAAAVALAAANGLLDTGEDDDA